MSDEITVTGEWQNDEPQDPDTECTYVFDLPWYRCSLKGRVGDKETMFNAGVILGQACRMVEAVTEDGECLDEALQKAVEVVCAGNILMWTLSSTRESTDAGARTIVPAVIAMKVVGIDVTYGGKSL